MASGDKITHAGLVAVGTAAAVQSFTSLAGLARLSGLVGHVGPGQLTWLLPLAVDAYAVTVTRVWLRGKPSDKAYSWARANAAGAITLSVAGNATFHALAAARITDLGATRWGWLLVVAVSSVAPMILGAVVHTAVLVGQDRDRDRARLEARSQSRPQRPESRSEDRDSERDSGPDSTGTGDRDKTGTTAGPETGTSGGQRLKLVPAGRGEAQRVMREHWVVERAAGRTPSGAELDRTGGTKDLGRRLRRRWLDEETTALAAGDGVEAGQ